MMKHFLKILIIPILLNSLFLKNTFGQTTNDGSNDASYTFYTSSLKFSERHSQLIEKKQLQLFDKAFLDSSKTISVKDNIKKQINKTKIHPVRLSIVLGGMFTAWLSMHIYYNRTWWKNKVSFFKFAEDPFYARDVDKLSHVYTANLIAVSSSELFDWSGLNPTLSMALGSVTAIAYETYIEINDGFSPDWGYDWGDMAGNFVGALYPIAQRYVPILRTVNVKWSFKPSWLEKKLRNYPDLLDDYTSMKFWITFNPYDLLSKKMQKWYPSILGFGLGVTLQNASHLISGANAYREWFLAFDIDITKLPGNTGFLKALKKILNFYHIPTPGIKISHGTIWYGLLF
jgi:hypothetical protein